MFGVGVMRTNAFHLEEAENKNRGSQLGRRYLQLCNVLGDSLSTAQRVSALDICSESVLNILGGRLHFGLDQQHCTWGFREQGPMVTMYVPRCVRVILAEMEFVMLG